MPDTRVLIIGGGPAACAAALRCRQYGLSVMMVCPHTENERSASESIHPGLLTLLGDLGVDPTIKFERGVYTGIISKGGFRSLDPSETEIWTGQHIDKNVFNANMRQHALAAGVIMVNNSVTQIHTVQGRVDSVTCRSGETYQARFFLDCSGRDQVAGRSLKLKKSYYSPPLVAWTGVACGDRKVAYQCEPTFLPQGDHWEWIAPERNNHHSWTQVAKKGWTDFSPPESLRQLQRAGPINVYNVRWRLFRPAAMNGLLLCGDAAALIDPASSQGILNAVMSGIMAAKAIRNILNNPHLEQWIYASYDQWVTQQFEHRSATLERYYRELLPEWFTKGQPRWR